MIVYKITNTINNKIYIGVTTRTLEERWREHKSRVKERTSHLYSAFRKYGIENFTIEIIDDTAESQEELFELEKRYIKQYNSTNPDIGYNATIGGDGVKTIELDEAKIVELYKQGNSSETIARTYNVSGNTITRCLRRNGITPNWNVDEELNQYIIQQYLIPRTVQDLIQETGKSKDSISRILRLHGIKRHSFRESHENISEIYSDYTSRKLTNEQICKKYSIHKSTLYKLVNYYKETYLN